MPSPQLRWGLISGEYPPSLGGVADYTAQLAAGLAAHGDEVHVWAPGPTAATPGVTVHPLPGRFGRSARRRLDAEIRALAPAPAPRLLIQYVPHAFGSKAMNLPFCRWVHRHRGLRPWVMYHEVAYPREPAQSARHRFLALVTARMAGRLQRAADASFVSIPAWGEWLRRIAPQAVPSIWLPVPSNLPTEAAADEVAALRSRLAPLGGPVVGSLGGPGEFWRGCLRRLVPALLAADERRTALLAGPGGPPLAAAIAHDAPSLGARLHAPGVLPPADAARHLAAADLLVQPYPDGISSRRGSAMAGLALGRAVLANQGRLTEPLWADSGAVALAPTAPSAQAQAKLLLPEAESLLRDPARRHSLEEAGQRLYRERFALEHTVRALRSAAIEAENGANP